MATTKLLTAEDLAAMPDDGYRYDLVRGVLIRMAPAAGGAGRVTNTVAWHMTTHVRHHQLGVVYSAETGFVLARDPDLVRASDVAFVRAERLTSDLDEDKFVPFPPDLAVEVVSPSDRARDVHDKVMDYLDAGVRLVWLIHLRRRTVTVYTSDRTARILREGDELDGGDVLPGFRLAVADIFR
jgi:Uma2 family endonuclease